MKKLLGGIMMAVGAMIAFTSGLCWSLVIVNSLFAFFDNPAQQFKYLLTGLPILAVFGLPPLLIGAALFWLGRKIASDT